MSISLFTVSAPVNCASEFRNRFEAATYEHETFDLYVSNNKHKFYNQPIFMIPFLAILDTKHIDPYDWKHKTKMEALGTVGATDMC